MMKKNILLTLLLIAIQITNAQVLDFASHKKTIALSTGITMKYVETGKNNSPVVIMLHGYTDTSRSFYTTIEALLKINPNLKIYALDLRGHGKSSMPDEQKCANNPAQCFQPSDFADDVIAFMKQLKISKAHLVGHSMGSAAAQVLAIQHPSLVRSLTLISSFADGAESEFIRDFIVGEILDKLWKTSLEQQTGFTWPGDAYTLKPTDLDSAIVNWIKTDWAANPIASTDFIEALYPETMQIPLGTWIGAITALTKTNHKISLAAIKVPTLVLWAIQDNIFPDTMQQELKASLSKAAAKNKINYHFKVYGKQPLPLSGMQESDFGHNLQWEAPEAVAADIASFIATGMPTNTKVFADPDNIRNIITENVKVIK